MIARTHGLSVHFYDDATQLYMACDPIDHTDTTSVLTQLENCISDLRIWMLKNKITLNDDAIGALLFTSTVLIDLPLHNSIINVINNFKCMQ